jgi:lysophospholipase L1-like esterase
MTIRSNDPDSTVEYLRSLEDRIKRLEAKMRTSDKTATKELRLSSSRKFDSLLVIGDSISQLNRLSEYNATTATWTKNSGGIRQDRWQDQLARRLALPGEITQYLPNINPPQDWQDYTAEGTGSFRHWDYSCNSITAEGMSEAFRTGVYKPPPITLDLVVIMLGVNDWSSDPQVSPDDYYIAMNQLATGRGLAYRDLVLVKPWQWGRGIPGSAEWSEYLEKIDLLGETLSAKVVTVYEGIVGPDLAFDGVHATQDGHNLIYSKIRSALSSVKRKPSGQATVASTSSGVAVGGSTGAIVIGDWKIHSIREDEDPDGNVGEGEDISRTLLATNLLSGVSTILA